MESRTCYMGIAMIGTVVSMCLFLAVRPVEATKDSWLITPQEAAMAPAQQAGLSGEIPVGAESDLGPKIEVVKPNHGGSALPPVEIDIKFVPKLSPVDPASLIVSVVKIFNVDITDRVRPFASAGGIHVPRAQLPSGKHTVRVSVADQDGLRSVKDVTFEVLEGK